MELKKYKKKIYLFLIFILIIFSINNNNNNSIGDNINDNIIPDNNTVSQYNLDDIFTELIEIKHEKGNSLVNYKLHSYIYKPGALQWGDYNLRINDISYIETAHDLSGISKGSFAGYTIDASLPWQNFISIASVPFYLSYFYGSKYESTSSFDIYDIWYPNNVDINPFLFTVKSPASFSYVGLIEADSNYYIQESDSHYSRDRFILYHLEPIINIDSDFYNYQNTRLELKTYSDVMVSGEYLSRSVSYEEKWIEMDYNDIILTHPIYSIRIFDLNNNLIYEENNINYSSYHECKIDSLKIQNNAPEPINASIIENGHYKGAYSFDLEEVHTQPEDFTVASNPGCLNYISNEIDGHNKVLTFNDQSATTYCYSRYDFSAQTSGSIEFWAYSSDPTYTLWFDIYSASGRAIYFFMDDDKFNYHNGSTYHNWPMLADYWYNIRIDFDSDTDLMSLWINEENKLLDESYSSQEGAITYINMYTRSEHSGYQYYIDALDVSWSDGYYEGRNQELNTSEDLWSWNAFPEWESGHYQETVNWGTPENPDLSDWSITLTNASNERYAIVDKDNFGLDVLEIEKDITVANEVIYAYLPFISHESGTIEFRTQMNDVSDGSIFKFGTGAYIDVYTSATNDFQYYNGSDWIDFYALTDNEILNIRVDFECGSGGYLGLMSDTFNFWVNGVKLVSDAGFASLTGSLTQIKFGTRSTKSKQLMWVDAICFSWDDNYFSGMNTLENTTTSPFPMETNYSTQVNPYSSVFTNYTVSNYLVGITDLYDNVLETQGLSNSSEDNEIIYTPPNVRTCLISLSDQRSNYLEWQNYRIKIDGNSIYEQYFYREIATIVNISVYDRFDQYLTSQVYAVERDDNFINIQLTLYSLKIYNQQEVFNYVNVTRDPNYYSTTEYWSEWIAPGEIIEYQLYSGYYKVNITDNENSQNTVYSYTLNGDDMLLITSSYTLTNTLINIANVNSTIGNQITNVEINITNQNSQINSSIVNVEINLTNVNSTIGDLLIAQNTTINAIGNNITTLFVYEQSTFNILNNSINTTFTQLNSSIYLVNNTIYTAVSAVEANLNNVNNTISGNLTMILQINEELTNLFINALFARYLDWTNASIDSNYIFDQTEYVDILNEYNNESLEIFFKYNDKIESLVLSSQDTLSQLIPNENVTYRWKSLDTGEYLTEWEEIPDNNTIKFGDYEEIIPATPDLVQNETNDWIIAVSIISLIAFIAVVIVILLMNKFNIKTKYEVVNIPSKL